MEFKLFSHNIDGAFNEVHALVTHHNSWAPNLVITCSNRKCVVVSSLQSFTGETSTHLVKYSVVVIMYLAPVIFAGGLIGPTESISILSNACNVTCGHNGISSLLLGLPTL
jgi:hypothetical protein